MPKQSPFWIHVLELQDLHRVPRDVAQKASDRLWPQMDEQSRFYYRQAVAPEFNEKAKLLHTAARRARLTAPALGSAEYAETLIVECATNQKKISDLENTVECLRRKSQSSSAEISTDPAPEDTRPASADHLNADPDYLDEEVYSPSIPTGADDPVESEEARQLELAETEIRMLKQKIYDLRAESEAKQRLYDRDRGNWHDGRAFYQKKIARLENELEESTASKYLCDHTDHIEQLETLNRKQSESNSKDRQQLLDLLNENYELKTQLLKTKIELKRAQPIDWPESSSSSHSGSV